MSFIDDDLLHEEDMDDDDGRPFDVSGELEEPDPEELEDDLYGPQED